MFGAGHFRTFGETPDRAGSAVDLVNIIILLGIVQGFFLGSLLILIKSPNRRANRFLGALFICFSISINHFILERGNLYEEFPHFVYTSFPVLFLFGPLFYLYVRVLTDRTVQLRPAQLLHGLPFALALVASAPVYLSTAEEKLAILDGMDNQTGVHMGLILGTVQVFHVFAYMWAVRRELVRYDRRIRNTKSSIEHINLRWLRIGTANFVLTFGMILAFIAIQAIGVNVLPIYNIAVPISVSVIIYYMGYIGLRQPAIFSPMEEMTETGRKYEKSTLTPEKARELLGRLKEYMTRERPYLESELTLPALAERLEVSPHHVSQVINEYTGQNFFDFVNSYRVEEARRLLQDGNKSAFTILAVAEEAGFNSKTAFNNAFKKLTGVTPSEFRSRSGIPDPKPESLS